MEPGIEATVRLWTTLCLRLGHHIDTSNSLQASSQLIQGNSPPSTYPTWPTPPIGSFSIAFHVLIMWAVAQPQTGLHEHSEHINDRRRT